MRLIVLTLALWLLTSVAMADVIFPDDPYPPLRRRWPNPPAVTELPVRTPPTVPTTAPTSGPCFDSPIGGVRNLKSVLCGSNNNRVLGGADAVGPHRGGAH
jgi:hypothetical protein